MKHKLQFKYSKLWSFTLPIIFILISSCSVSRKSKDDLLRSDIWKVAYELQAIKKTDQQIRNAGKFMNYYYGDLTQERLFDEFKWKNYDFTTMSDSLEDFLKRPTFNNNWMNKEYERETIQQSIATKYIDSLNLHRLIEVTEYYGFPDHERLKRYLPDSVSTSLTSSPHLIFVHTRESMKNTVESLIIKEYKAGRIDINPCSHVFWHLNGRKEWPIDFDYCSKFD
jgi:hypothetical protein